MISIDIYVLKDCYFSQKALYRLNSLNLNCDINVTKVTETTKEKYKRKNKMDTFPQIFILNDKKKFKIGGSTDLDNLERMIDEMNTYEFSIKSFCLFHELLNKK
jgi:glutaredoxin